MHCKLISVMIHRPMYEKTQQTIIIPNEYANERLDQTLAKLLPDYSRTQIQDWIEQGPEDTCL